MNNTRNEVGSGFLARFRRSRRAWLKHGTQNHQTTTSGRESERGDATIEFVIWGGALMLTVLLGLYGFRLASARGEIQAAAQAGARTASLQRTSSKATAAGSDVALGSLPVGDRTCITATATVNTTDWDNGWVEVTVTCVVDFAGLNPIAAGTKTIDYTWVEPVDTARREVTP